jgi:hypothetical protein
VVQVKPLGVHRVRERRPTAINENLLRQPGACQKGDSQGHPHDISSHLNLLEFLNLLLQIDYFSHLLPVKHS